MFHKKTYSVIIITTFLIFFSFICFGKAAFSTQKGKLFLQIVKQPEEKILVEFRIERVIVSILITPIRRTLPLYTIFFKLIKRE